MTCKSPFLLFCFSIFIVCAASAQVKFQKKFLGTASVFGAYLKQASDGGYVVVGNEDGIGTQHTFLLRLNADGDTLWTKIYDAGGPYAFDETIDKGFVMCCNKNSATSNDQYLITKVDSLGIPEWATAYDVFNFPSRASIVATPDGGCLVAGCGQPPTLSEYNLHLVKLSPTGQLDWSKEISSVNNRDPKIIALSDGGFAIANQLMEGLGGYGDVCILKVDALGNPLWMKSYGTNLVEGALDIAQTADSGLVVLGFTKEFTPPSGTQYSYVIRTNKNGDHLWSKTYHTDTAHHPSAITQTKDGGIAITGSYNNGSIGSVSLVIKADDTGKVDWAKSHGSAGSAFGGIVCTQDSGLIITGATIDTSMAAYLVKTDANGISGCLEQNILFTEQVVNTLVTSHLTIVSAGPLLDTAALSVIGAMTSATICYTNSIASQQPKSTEVQILPNPSTGNFKIICNSATSLDIIDLQGRILLTQVSGSGRFNIDISHFSKGFYICHLRNNTGQIAQAKLILQ